jgi:hypothetical protein
MDIYSAPDDLQIFESLKSFPFDKHEFHPTKVPPVEGRTFKGHTHSEESRKKISEAAKKQIRKPFSEETKRKIAQTKIGKTFSHNQQTKKKISLAVKGRSPISEETRKRLSVSAKNRKTTNYRKAGEFTHDESAKAKISNIIENKARRPIVSLIKELNGSAHNRKMKLTKGWWQKSEEELQIILAQLESIKLSEGKKPR